VEGKNLKGGDSRTEISRGWEVSRAGDGGKSDLGYPIDGKLVFYNIAGGLVHSTYCIV
jgi:hypothetical protein